MRTSILGTVLHANVEPREDLIPFPNLVRPIRRFNDGEDKNGCMET